MNNLMDTNLSSQPLNTSLRQLYDSVQAQAAGTLTQSYSRDLWGRLNKILTNYKLSDYQTHVLKCLFTEFDYVEDQIDPKKLDFGDAMNEDDELILHRTSEAGTTNLIIHTNELVARSFIGKGQKTVLDFFEASANTLDYQHIVLTFLSK